LSEQRKIIPEGVDRCVQALAAIGMKKRHGRARKYVGNCPPKLQCFSASQGWLM
jgi:hypothetical protein